MQSLAVGMAKVPARLSQGRLSGLALLSKGIDFEPKVIGSGTNQQQCRFYDRERRYVYMDRRYEKDFDMRYDAPSVWTLHPNFKLRSHFEEHSTKRGSSMLVLTSVVFFWFYCATFAMYYLLPFPEEEGRPGSGSEGYRRWFKKDNK